MKIKFRSRLYIEHQKGLISNEDYIHAKRWLDRWEKDGIQSYCYNTVLHDGEHCDDAVWHNGEWFVMLDYIEDLMGIIRGLEEIVSIHPGSMLDEMIVIIEDSPYHQHMDDYFLGTFVNG